MRHIDEEVRLADTTTGAPLGFNAIHPITKESIPVYLASYVSNSHTGALMGVPAHDQRDWNFAKAHNLPVKTVVQPATGPMDATAGPFTEPGIMAQGNGDLSGLTSDEAEKKVIDLVTKGNFGKVKPNVRLRDWLVSRQRYWGTPIPIVHCEGSCNGPVPVPEEELPIVLPASVNLAETSEFCKSPLSHQKDWVHTNCPV